ncbi:glycoside hydrolase family 43 protein [Salibacterium lacus]|uniref:Glycoside hydrolase family 43 protein n=1 Tax=Salibacterium lacus TaxID=1898109 RepID=A0ABW5SZG6_9BACI
MESRKVVKKALFSTLAVVFIGVVFWTVIISNEEETTVERNGSAENNNKKNKEPNFSEVAVHDPSIIKEEDTFYIFGTHIEAAKSKDLMNWESFTNGYETPNNSLYGDLSANLSESFEWAGEDDADSQGGFAVWAPEIFWNEDYVNDDGSTGAYMIYYSVSSTYIRSAIGYAVSKDIEGPYEYVDTVVYSGFTEQEDYDENSDVNKKWTNTNIPDLVDEGHVSEVTPAWFNQDGSYNNTMYPNAIDANVFYDKNGTLWMSYGSWSGGIFLHELDKETGGVIHPEEDGKTEDGRMIDRYFGTKISGGYGKSGEGPYIVYDEESEYYFLYKTYGWLGSDGEYNMRVFRSESPEGPFVDAQGNPAVLPEDTDNAPFGNKLMGHYTFKSASDDSSLGYFSPGHNSVYVDSDTNQQYLVFHTRFPDSGEKFEVRVHPLYMNENDWPVAAPYRYSGERLEEVSEENVIGDYKFINHKKDNTDEVKTSSEITLHDNYDVSGEIEGTWELLNEHEVRVTVDDETYSGVFVKQWDPLEKQNVWTFTAASDQGMTIWGSRTSALK